MSTHISSGADEVLASTAESGPMDPLDALLGQIVGGYFVLTDGQGSVSKWSEPAELLFGRPAQEILGQSFFSTLVQSPLPANAEAWRRFLEAGDSPTAPGKVEVQGLRADGGAFPLEAVFVPVKLDEGFDFSLFLEDLGFELPLNLMLLRMRQQHPVVVRALGKAIEADPQPWEGWRTAEGSAPRGRGVPRGRQRQPRPRGSPRERGRPPALRPRARRHRDQAG